MYTVHHYNFGTIRHFDTLEEAKAFAVRACFEAVVYSTAQRDRIASFSPISGWRWGYR